MKWIPGITKFQSLILDVINKYKVICIAKDFIMYFQKNVSKFLEKISTLRSCCLNTTIRLREVARICFTDFKT
jgi:hypothetical protein